MLIAEGEKLWEPSPERVDAARITAFVRWLDEQKGLSFSDYESLWQWSVTDLDGFWRAIWEYFEIASDADFENVVAGEGIFKARWFEGSQTNYAEHVLRHETDAQPGETAFYHSSEIRPPAEMSWQDLGASVRTLAEQLRGLGIEPGDRIVSYMPNVPETAIAMLATTAIGAIWSSAAPEFGSMTVIDRFSQIEPKLGFFADGYSFNGKVFDRNKEIQSIVDALPSLETVVWFDYVGTDRQLTTERPTKDLVEMLAGPAVSRDAFEFTRVPWDHPLWVLYSSGTTGLPKAIVHSHCGMIAEHLKNLALQTNLGPGKRMFFYSTTGWMMWNLLVSSLMTGASSILYDGSPVYGGIDRLWRMASEARTTMFGASPSLVENMNAAGVRPKDLYDLSSLDMVMVTGAPSTPATFKWFYDEVASDLWVSSQSGGTDMCSGILSGVVTAPVYAGEIQCRGLGMATEIWDDEGKTIVDEVGELVITRPFPAAPLGFWGDEDDKRYYESYYDTFPGIWRHGDLAKINQRGGAYVYGRADSTLNRYGVRIGSGEIYAVMASIKEIKDSMIICYEPTPGAFFMPMFVVLADNVELTDELKKSIAVKLRTEASPRHVPDDIYSVPEVPYTLSLKKMEVPVRKILTGADPDNVASRDTMSNPASLDWFVEFSSRKESKI
jgi:acetoacetyl-CoA synthetase